MSGTSIGPRTFLAVLLASLMLPATAAAAGERLWFTEPEAARIGAVSTAGSVIEYPLPAGSQPSALTASAASLWFTESGAARVSRFNTFGSVAQDFTVGAGPSGIVFGPDGNLWFAETDANAIGRLTPAGILTEYPISNTPSSQPGGIVAGPDGAIWFTENAGNKIGRIFPGTSQIDEFPLPAALGASPLPAGIAKGPDAALWFTMENADKIGRIRTDGTFEPTGGYATPSQFAASPEIVAGPDGALWFTLLQSSPPGIGRMKTDGTLEPPNGYPLPTGSAPDGIAVGPDGAIWFTEGANKIGRITTSGQLTEFPTTAKPGDIVTGPPESSGGGSPGPAPAPPAPVGPSGKPSVQSLSLSPSSFKAAKAGASIAAKKVGAKVTYRLSMSASTKFTVARETAGRKKGKKCVKQTPRNRKAKKCKLYKAVRGSFTHSGKAGSNSFKFTGRVGGKSLKPGRYQLSAVATAGSSKSTLKTANFKIVR